MPLWDIHLKDECIVVPPTTEQSDQGGWGGQLWINYLPAEYHPCGHVWQIIYREWRENKVEPTLSPEVLIWATRCTVVEEVWVQLGKHTFSLGHRVRGIHRTPGSNHLPEDQRAEAGPGGGEISEARAPDPCWSQGERLGPNGMKAEAWGESLLGRQMIWRHRRSTKNYIMTLKDIQILSVSNFM